MIWITGLSGAGKTTVARAVVRCLRGHGLAALLLDGDTVRQAIGDATVAHDRASRLTNAYRIARLARLMAEQDMIVAVATMSLFHEIHAWNRRHLPAYYEVLLKADADVRAKRDPKGIYARAAAGVESHVGGLDLAIELPLAPHIALRNNGDSRQVPAIARRIVRAFLAWRGGRALAGSGSGDVTAEYDG